MVVGGGGGGGGGGGRMCACVSWSELYCTDGMCVMGAARALDPASRSLKWCCASVRDYCWC